MRSLLSSVAEWLAPLTRTLGLERSLLVIAIASGGCGHTIAPGVPFVPGAPFDFRHPAACADAKAPDETAPPDHVVVRYLGAGGLYVGWRGEALLTGPFFSNPGLLRVAFGRMRLDGEAVLRGLEGVPMERVGAILVGHSHYDHVGDLPLVAALAPQAGLYVNESGLNALDGPFPSLRSRLRPLEKIEKEGWSQLTSANGRALPFRILAVPSEHAPHFDGVTLWSGETEASEKPWRRRRYGALGAGQPYAFVLDLLDDTGEGARVVFRLFVQDSAAGEGQGYPPNAAPGDPPYDLAVVCVASAQWVEGYPGGLLRLIKPQHVLLTHYENFFRPWGPRRGFVPLLTRGVTNRFIESVDGTLATAGISGVPPVTGPCGPRSPRWTMPLTGEWLVFRPRELEKPSETR